MGGDVKIYTKTGDAGETGLFGGARVSKASARVSVYGDVDELNSTLGMVRVEPFDETIDELLATIQSDLFGIGAELAAQPGKDTGLRAIGDDEVEVLERAIDRDARGGARFRRASRSR